MTHEGAHALLAVSLGLTVTDIVLDRHSEGKTSIVGDGLRVVLVVLIGYLGPSLFGLGAAKLISLGYPLAVLWLLVLLLVLVLFLLGRSFGLLRSQTHLPRTFFSLVWLAGTLLALVVGGKLLVLG